MRTLFLLVFILCTGELFSQTQQGKTNQQKSVSANQQKTIPYDTIVRFGNRKIPVVRLTIGATDVSFGLPGKPDSTIRLSKKEIEMIIYKNGNKDIYNKSLVEVVSPDQWQAVLVTKDAGDVQGLYLRGTTTKRSSRSAKTKKKAIENVYIQLQKFAAGKKATYVLIKDDKFDGGYGDIPGYIVEAEIYGPEPLETGTNVVNPNDKSTTSQNKK